MKTKFRILSLKEKDLWDSYLKRLPQDQQDIYFTPEYYSLYQDYGDGLAQCFVFEKDDKIALYPFLINSVNRLGYSLDKEYFDIQGAYGYNGIISSSYDSNFIDEFYSAFDSYCTDNKIIAEFTRFHPVLKNYLFSENHISIILDRKTRLISLLKFPDMTSIRKLSYSKEARKNYKKALKQGLSYSIAEKKDYETFYNIYRNTMKGIGANDYYLFSKNLINSLLNFNDHQKLIIIRYQGQIVGGLSLFLYGDYAHNFISAGLLSYRDLKINDYMQDVALSIALDYKKKIFHMGGGNSNDPNDSLFSFKSKFTKEEALFCIGKKIHNKSIYDSVVEQWKLRYPESFIRHSNMLLGYREI